MFEDGEEVLVDDKVDDGSGSGSGDDGGAAANPQPFLKVDDRTVFNKPEDAVRSYQEAGRRIAELTPWQKELAATGVKDPKEAAALIAEARQAREAKVQADAEKARTDADAQLTDQERKAQKWLTDNAKKLGLTSKADVDAQIKPLLDKIAQLESGNSEAQSDREEQRINQARDVFNTLCTEAKIPDNPQLRMSLETVAKSFIEEDPERLRSFFKGGDIAQKTVKEAFEYAKGVYQSMMPAAAARSASAMGTRGSSTRPPNGASKDSSAAPRTPAKKPGEKPKSMTDAEMWEATMKIFDEHQEENS